jgi:RecA-family ATPase
MTPSEYSRLTDGFDPIGMTPLEVRLAMIAKGYNPTPLDGKKPLLNGWQNLVATELLAQQWGNIGPNTGALTKDTPVLDIDILDEHAAQIVEATARLFLEDKGEILVRVGLPPKRAILLRTDKPFRKIIRKLTSLDGTVHKIEVLGAGQQLAVAGIHPDTKKPNVWKGGKSPVNVPREMLPLVDADEVQTLLDLCVGELKAKLGWGEIVEVNPALSDDVEACPLNERLAATEYKGQYGLNDAILGMTANLISDGRPVTDVTEECMKFVRGVWDKIPDEHPDKVGWKWNTQRDQITDACYGFIKKQCDSQPRIIDTLPDWMLTKWREIEARGGTPFLKKRRFWGVEDKGPAEEIPTVETTNAPDSREDRRAKRPAPGNVLKTFEPFDPARLPAREWVLDKHYQRGVVTVTGGYGGRGKSTNALVEAIVLATGRPLMGEAPRERCRVWYHCADDNMVELQRRVAAICQHYMVPMEELRDWLFLTTPLEFGVRVAEGYSEVTINDKLVAQMHEQIEANTVDVVVLDPLVRMHRAGESNPVAMGAVIDVFWEIAAYNDCGLEVVHHVRKSTPGQTDVVHVAEDLRGAGSISDLVRSVRMLNVMDSKDCIRLCIPEHERRRYIRVSNEKGNYIPPEKASWLRLVSVLLPNGDDVGVVERWQFPDTDGPETPEMAEANRRLDGLFLSLLREHKGPTSSAKTSLYYAPKILAKHPTAKAVRVSKETFEAVLERLLADGRVVVGSEKTANGGARERLMVADSK